jgi:hypothetical protein
MTATDASQEIPKMADGMNSGLGCFARSNYGSFLGLSGSGVRMAQFRYRPNEKEVVGGRSGCHHAVVRRASLHGLADGSA